MPQRAGKALPDGESWLMGTAARTTIDEADLAHDLRVEEARTSGDEPHRCDGCGRSPLIGESIAVYADGTERCDLCRAVHRETPTAERLVKHAPDGPRSRVRVIRRLPV